MSYFVTGGTGFLGRFLIGNLLKRKGTIHVLVRKDSLKKFDALAKKQGWDPKRVVVLEFPTMARAREWYHSADYAAALAMRLKAAKSRVILVEGC